jgi:hypothetical protein
VHVQDVLEIARLFRGAGFDDTAEMLEIPATNAAPSTSTLA